jgi:hypothetical protein
MALRSAREDYELRLPVLSPDAASAMHPPAQLPGPALMLVLIFIASSLLSAIAPAAGTCLDLRLDLHRQSQRTVQVGPALIFVLIFIVSSPIEGRAGCCNWRRRKGRL